MQRVRVYAGVLAALLAMSCDVGSMTPTPVPTGKATVAFAPTAPQATNLTLSQASVQLEQLSVLGDVTPDPRTMLSETRVDMLSTAAQSHVFDQTPQGLYSRVHFRLEEIHFLGTYGAYQLVGKLDYEMYIDLRDAMGLEVGVGQSAVFTVAFDGTRWFGNNGDLLAQAVPTGNQILIDSMNNATIGHSIAANVAAAISLTTAQGPN